MSGALSLLAGLVLEDGRRWGDAASGWQWADARAVLEPGDGDPLQHFLTRPRGGSKTTDLAAVVIAALVEQLPPAARAYWVAADRDQGRLGVDALAGLVARTPGLAGQVAVDTWRASARSGASIEVLAADGPSAFGLRPALVIADELAVWPASPNARQVWEALVSAMPKVPGSRLVVISSAGDPAHWSNKVRQHALGSSRWRVNEVPGPLPWVPAAALAEQRALLTDSQYARLHLNVWTASEDRLVGPEELQDAVVLDGPQKFWSGHRYRIGADIGIRHDRTAVAVCHAVNDEDRVPPARRVVLDRMMVWRGSREREVRLDDVEDAIWGLSMEFGRAPVRLDPWQGVGMAQRLRARGVAVEEWSFSAARYGQMAQVLFTLLRDRLLSLFPDDALLDELASVRLRESAPGLLRVDTDPGAHNFDDQVVALGFAATAVLEHGGWAAHRSGPYRRLRSMPPTDTYLAGRAGF